MTVPEMSETLEALLEYVRRTRGFDFTGYKHPSLMRRTRKRMQVVGIQDVGEYLDYMEVHPDEFTHLFNTILINVTAFFRDPQAWDFLAREAITRILGDRGASDPIRVWSAGCASGEEAYSLAMLLAEALGPEAFRQRVKIYATDVDTEALGQGRQGSYSEKDLEPVSAERRTQFFERVGDRYIFRPELRRSVIFGRHDLVQDAPISRQDLILCRNTLIYFNAETQGRVLARFHFALNDNGFLFLGRAETLLTHASLFMPLDLRHRVFSSVPRALSRERVAVLNPGGSHSPGEPLSRQLRLRHAALETAPVGRIMLDRQGSLVVANERARALLGLTTNDLGRSFRDIEAAFRLADLASRIEQAMTHRHPSSLTDVERRFPTGEVLFLEVQVVPLVEDEGGLLGVSVSLLDVTQYRRLAEEIRRGRQEQETVNAELQASNEELVTTNEELQSSVEELETTNEELQSANEEMETMNEELQSTNAQLLTANDSLRQRDGELNTSNAFLGSILTSMPLGVVVVDRRFNILMWNQKAEDLWGLRAEEVRGKSLFELEIGLPVAQLAGPIQGCLSGERAHQDMVLDAINRRGKSIKCEIVCTRLMGPLPNIQGAILVMEEKKG